MTIEQILALVLTDIKLDTCDRLTFERVTEIAEHLRTKHEGVMDEEVEGVK